MNELKRLLVASLLLLMTVAGFAQGRTITGRVLGDDKAPLPGVTVKVKNTNRTTQTSSSGNFTINAEPGETLQFTHVGFDMKEVAVGSSASVTITLSRSDNTLGELVVTAMDIKRNPKELTYSVQTVKGSEVAETQRENFVNSLQGRVAGLTLTPTSGLAGSSSQIVLRGLNSMALSNSPLFVIDGIIVDNSSISENDGSVGTGAGLQTENRYNDYTNRIADINPADIESITVLKGPEATALYGSQASSGAIVITTKKAQAGRTSISYDNSFRIQKINRLPEIQRTFSGGTNGVPQDIFTYFGPAYGSNTTIYDNDIRDFFQTGFSQTHNVSAEVGKKNYSFRFSGSAFTQDAVVPNNSYNKYNARISNYTKIGKYVDITPSFSYIRSTNDRPLRGAGGYLVNFLTWPANNDVTQWQDANGLKLPLYASNPNSEIDNPYYNVNRVKSWDETDRIIGTLGVNVNPVKWLSIAGRFGYDTYKTDGGSRYDSMSYLLSRAQRGAQNNYYRRYYGYNHTITATARHSIGDFTGRLMVGNMWQDYETRMMTVYGTNINDFMSFDVKDSSVTDPTTRQRNLNWKRNGLPNYSISRQSAYFGEASINWKNAIFLNYSHRFEESSIFPKAYRSYNYPAGGLSIMLSELIPGVKNSSVMNYLKVRGSLASTARSGAPYANQSVFNENTGSGGGWYYGFTNANPLLSPEKQHTYETGLEARFLNNRLNLDFTYYNTKNTNLIVENFRASYGTGFVLNTLNVGSNKNTGVEIALDAVPVQTKNLRWSTRFNFNRMRNEVTSLPDNVPEFYISDTWLYGNARGGLIVGGPTTSITSYGYKRNDNGDILISPTTGLPIIDQTFKVRGDRNPDFTLGFLSNLTYKNFRFSMLWDVKKGGDIFNATEMFLTIRGRSVNTADRMTPRVIQGVLQDGLENTTTPTKNTIAITPYYNQAYYTTMPEEEFIEHNVNWLRLRDVTLNYTFSPKTIKNLKFLKSLSAFVTGNDLFMLSNYQGADPAVSGVSAGSRGVGAFGFDYGNIGTPISVNLGIRANF